MRKSFPLHLLTLSSFDFVPGWNSISCLTLFELFKLLLETLHREGSRFLLLLGDQLRRTANRKEVLPLRWLLSVIESVN